MKGCTLLRFSLTTLLVLIIFLPEARADNIAVYGELDTQSLTALGHSVTVLSLAEVEAGDFSGFDVLLLGHIVGDSSWSSGACSSVETFLSGGGGVIAEWNAVDLLFSAAGASPWMQVTPRCSLFSGTADGGDVLAFATPITITDPLSPLVSGLDDGFDLGDGSESFVNLSGLDGNWVQPATFNGVSGPAPALLAARYGRGGWAVAAPMDLFDAFGWGGSREADASTLLGNLIRVAQWPECQPDGVAPVDASDLAVEIRVLKDAGFSPPGHADCIPAGGIAVSDFVALIGTIFGS